MQQKSYVAFTLIELLVVISIIAIISVAIYFPYAFHQRKILVKQSTYELSQSLNSARNMAIHGRADWGSNFHIGLYFPDSKSIVFQSYPYNSSTGSLLDADVLESRLLPRWVSLTDSLVATEYFFEAISWELTKRELQGNNFQEVLMDEREIFEVYYTWSDSDNLRSQLYYFTRSHITDF